MSLNKMSELIREAEVEAVKAKEEAVQEAIIEERKRIGEWIENWYANDGSYFSLLKYADYLKSGQSPEGV